MNYRQRLYCYSLVATMLASASLVGCGGRILVSEDTFNCSPEQPKGICPTGYTCVNGTCEADYQPCSAAYPHGVCESGVCVDGVCQKETPETSACSAQNPQGRCQDGFFCDGGTCKPLKKEDACSAEVPNGWCDSGYCCTNGTCWPCDDECNISHPYGRCPAGQICDGGICKESSTVATKCGPSQCEGLCEYGQECIQGLDNNCSCRVAAPPNSCTTENPDGNCPEGQWCLAGKCQVIEDAEACGKNCGGVCPGHAYCVPNSKGCSCQAEAGELVCSAANPSGLCPDGLACIDGSCAVPSCSSSAPWGLCPAGQSCVKGKCQAGGDECSVANPTGVCNDICEGEDCYEAVCDNGVCVAATCSSEHLRGRCGGDCLICHEGACVTPPCSKEYACGVCPSCQVCNDNESSPDYGTCGPAACSLACPQGACGSVREICATSGYCEVPSCSAEFPWGDCRTGLYCEQDKGICENFESVADCSSDVSCVWNEELQECVRRNYGKCTLQECGSVKDLSNLVCNNPACEALADVNACVGNSECTWGRCQGSGTCPANKDKEACDENENCWWEVGCFDARVCQEGHCIIPTCSKLYPTGKCDDGLTCYDGECIKLGCESDNDCNPLSEKCEELPIGTKGCIEQPCSVEKPQGSCLLLGTQYFGEICDGGNCVIPSCSTEYPGGACSDDVCTAAGTPAACSAAASHCRWREGCVAVPGHLGPADGTDCTVNSNKSSCEAVQGCKWQGCVDGRICAGGSCLLPPCSESVPDGSCPSGMSCEAGTCTLQNCGPVNPVGPCLCSDLSESDCKDEIAGLGCKWENGSCVDDKTASGFRICRNGVCQPFVCGSTFGVAPCLQSGTICGLPGSKAQCAPDDPGNGDGISTPCCFEPSCCETYPSGACRSASERCSGGACVLKPCSPDAPEGACGANRVCDSDTASSTFGTCIMAACSATNPGGHCDCSAILDKTTCQNSKSGFGCIWQNGACIDDPNSADSRKCVDGVCEPYLCGADFPNAPCAESGAVCGKLTGMANEICLSGGDGKNSNCCFIPRCSASYPTGQCDDGFICNNGECRQLPCSASNPIGACGAGKVCENGVCVSAPCSAAVPKGSCNCSAITTKSACTGTGSSYGCVWSNDACIDDPSSSASTSCLNGTCAPYLCRAEFPNAPCTSSGYVCKVPVGGEVCEGTTQGSTGACCVKPACSADYPGGSCPAGQSCSSGKCVDLPCSSVNKNGACATGKVCKDGTCVTAPCSADAPNGTCDNANERCYNGKCTEYLCSKAFPNAPCAQSGTVCGKPANGESCVDGGDASSACCFKPVCSPAYPSGSCQDSYICKNGTCTQLPCSEANKNGACGSGQYCDNGTCKAIACSKENPTGPCSESNQRCVNGECKNYLCGPDFPNAPCAQSGTVCGKPANGESCADGGSASGACCFKPICSPAYPSGSCDDGYICKSGTCQQLPCSSVNKNGACGSGQYCDNGTCKAIACGKDNPTGPCADSNQRCVNGECKDYLCGPDFPNAPCAQSGTVCGKLNDSAKEHCVAGSSGNGTTSNCCFEPWCSAAYPSGNCQDGYICKSGTCIQLPCSTSAPNGACGANQRCVEGTCQAAPCGPTALNGTCLCADLTSQGACEDKAAGFGCVWTGKECVDDPTSSFYQKCVDGICTPYLCGSDFTNGPCENSDAVCGVPSGADKCLDTSITNPGVNNPCCFIPHCSATYKNGTCDDGYICNNGTCELLPCSATVPNGSCPDGQECSSGTCIKSICSSSAKEGRCECADIKTQAACQNAATGFGCVWSNNKCIDDQTSTNSQRCLDGSCVPYLCSSDFPNAPCAVAGTVCGKPANGESCADGGDASGACCYVPKCSATYPGGSCPTGQYCSGGKCEAYPCSATNPTGACPASQVCNNGVCELAACSSTAPNGTCYCSNNATSSACNASLGCKWSNNKCIDDPDSVDSMRCSGGTCVPYLCGPGFPTAPCAESGAVCGKLINTSKESCLSGGNGISTNCCFEPWCSATYPSGKCDAGYVCNSGVCTKLPCSAANQNGACAAGQYCDKGTCTRYDCSDTYPTGTCSSGKICEKDNGAAHYSCSAPDCSVGYPYGECHVAGTTCVNGACVATCGTGSGQTATGYCSGGLACVMAACTNACENDYDCDGIPNTIEGEGDADNDGIPNNRDIDSDGDGIPDSVEAGGDPTHPLDTDGDGIPDYLETDADNDGIPDSVEVGPIPTQPLDSDGDGIPDYRDPDSDDDGIYDKYEGAGDVDGDGIPNYLDTDADGDGIPDSIEAKADPSDPNPLPAGAAPADHDGDGTYDFLDLDSDNDGVLDRDEDVNGNGIVDCQVNGRNQIVYVCSEISDKDVCEAHDCTWSPSTKVCSDNSNGCSSSTCAVNAYNPGCQDTGSRCILSETSRIHVDSDCDGMGDGNDGLYLACAADNLKPVNVFYDREADIAMALEQAFNVSGKFSGSTNGGYRGIYFDAANGSAAYGVSGFVLAKTPASSAFEVNEARQKVIRQEEYDRDRMSSLKPSVVISRYSETFDGFATSIFRYTVTTTNMTVSKARDAVLKALTGDNSVSTTGQTYGPSATAYTLIIQTIYRYDDTSTGRVILLGAIVPTALYASCGANNSSQTCTALASCNWANNKCAEFDCRAATTSGACNSTHCTWNATDETCDNKQLPLFYVNNVTSGSTVTQFGDDLDKLCQSFSQKSGKVDFLWLLDFSNSIEPARTQIKNSAATFFELLNNTEADYRAAQTGAHTFDDNESTGSGSTYNNGMYFGVNYGWNTSGTANTPWPPNYDFRECAPLNNVWAGANGCLIDEFTGSLIFSDDITNRDFYWNCGASIKGPGCSTKYTCAACNGATSGTIYAPECYFASRMVCDAEVGNSEMPLLMAEWAMYRYFDKHICGEAFEDGSYPNADTCATRDGCFWYGGECIPNNCSIATTEAQCETLPESGGIRLMGCLWNSSTRQCVPNYSCDAAPNANGKCSKISDQTTCTANGCTWSRGACSGTLKYQRCEDITEEAKCKQGAPLCYWNGSKCSWSVCDASDRPYATYSRCSSATSQNACEQSSTCIWENGICRALPKVRMRTDATPIIVAVTDEEECFLKDSRGYRGNGGSTVLTSNSCGGFYYNRTQYGKDFYLEGYDIQTFGYDWYTPNSHGYAVRQARQDSFAKFFQSRGAMVFTLTGEKATSATNVGGCSANGIEAEPGNALISVAENTGGGWGSVCATNVYPAVESIIINSLAKSSAYKLEAAIDGKKVQPIGSTIKVVAEVCADDPNMTYMNKADRCNQTDQYSCRANGCKWSNNSCSGCNNRVAKVIPMSRENGFDYDALNNTITLFGNARPARGRDIVVSFRYWINNPQLPEGPDINNCSCPGTSKCGELTTSAACAAHNGCSWSGGKCEGEYATDCSVLTTSSQCAQDSRCEWKNNRCEFACGCEGGAVCGGTACASQGTEAGCLATVGCAWANDMCMSTGICTIDPTCGGTCSETQTCNPNTGICECNLDCNNACGLGEFCNHNQECGSISSEDACRAIESEGVCEWRVDALICEDGNCGTCACDTTCGGCPTGKLCDGDDSSNTCGQCLCDSTCSTAKCGTECSTLTKESDCNSYSFCSWSGSSCKRTAYVECDGNTTSASCGFCVVDSDCSLHPCQTGEICNPTNGMCECDTSCGGGCKAGFICDSSSTSPTCGSCMCDTTCGGVTPGAGLKCDTDTSSPTCGLFICDTNCGAVSVPSGKDCDSDPNSPTCGQIVCDTTCGNVTPTIGMKCDDNTNSTTCGQIVCGAACNGGCTAGFVCDETKGQCGECVCDTTCGGSCPSGQECDSNTASATCGQCVCDTDCGKGCPENYTCDSVRGSATCGQCLCDITCGGLKPGSGQKCDDNSASPTCGQIVCDTSCGGGCPAGQVCDATLSSVTCGQCQCDTDCGNAEPEKGMKCDGDTTSPTCGQFICDTDCGNVKPGSGMKCDDNSNSPTCGQIVCDTECGEGCTGNKVCDSSMASTTCGSCICGDACGGNCPVGQTCNPALGDCGTCVCDQTCGGSCPSGQVCDSDTGSKTCGSCVCDTKCGNVTPGPGMKCDKNELSATCGQIVCDTTCGGSCGSGKNCDDNVNSATCGQCICPEGDDSSCLASQKWVAGSGSTCGSCVCDTTCKNSCSVGQTCDKDTTSATCGTCVCDTKCGNATPGPGMKCDKNELSATCGQIVCDTTCGGSCGSGKNCDDNVNSPTCGQCVCPEGDDSMCLASQKWEDGKSGACGGCVCDTTCKNSCSVGQKCDNIISSSTCGQCVCDTDCTGQTIGKGQKCDNNPASNTCGQPICDTECGNGCGEGYMCDSNKASTTCGQCVCAPGSDENCLPGQKWDSTQGACGGCVCDTTCGGGCLTGQVCDGTLGSPTCGQCICDETCGGSCPDNWSCDSDKSSATCGQCKCDTTCGGTGKCSGGLVCDDNSASQTCGQCICDQTCGGSCPAGQSCDQNLSSNTCGQCICDTTCGGSCPTGQICDGVLGSPTCGLCACDTTCGYANAASIPAGKVCDSNPTSTTCGQLVCDTNCTGQNIGPGEKCDNNPASPTCGQVVCDTTCGGACLMGEVCDSDINSNTCGQCECDITCGGDCPSGQVCDSDPFHLGTCGTCVCDTTCGGAATGDGLKCDSDPSSPTCGQVICDTSCGGPCATGTTCDTNSASNTCGQCICDQTCGGLCAAGSGQNCDSDLNSPTCGQCLCDDTCGGSCPSGQCCDGNDECAGLSVSQCNATGGCVYREAIGACESLTCGQCQVDPTCCNCQELPAGQTSCCATGTTCNASTGLCEVNADCCSHIPEAQRDQYKCNIFTGQCIFIAG